MTQTPTPPTEVSQRLGDIANQLGGVVAGLQEITGYGRRTRRLTWLAIGSFVLDILLTLAFAFSLSVSQANTCHAANDARAGQVIIWHTLIDKFATTNPSHAEKIREEHFLAFVDQTFHPLNCRGLIP